MTHLLLLADIGNTMNLEFATVWRRPRRAQVEGGWATFDAVDLRFLPDGEGWEGCLRCEDDDVAPTQEDLDEMWSSIYSQADAVLFPAPAAAVSVMH